MPIYTGSASTIRLSHPPNNRCLRSGLAAIYSVAFSVLRLPGEEPRGCKNNCSSLLSSRTTIPNLRRYPDADTEFLNIHLHLDGNFK